MEDIMAAASTSSDAMSSATQDISTTAIALALCLTALAVALAALSLGYGAPPYPTVPLPAGRCGTVHALPCDSDRCSRMNAMKTLRYWSLCWLANSGIGDMMTWYAVLTIHMSAFAHCISA